MGVLSLASAFGLLVLNALISPLGWDVMGSVGAVNQIQYAEGDFVSTISDRWDHRPFFYVLLIGALFLIPNSLGLETNSLPFELVFQGAFLFIFVPLILFSSTTLAESLGVSRRRAGLLSIFAAGAFVGVSQPWVFLQPDHVAAILIFIGCGLYFHRSKSLQLLAGIVAGLSIGVKAPFALVAVVAFAGAAAIASTVPLTELKQRFWRGVLGGSISAGLYGASLVAKPLHWEDFKLFSVYQGSFEVSLLKRLEVLGKNIFENIWHVPLLSVLTLLILVGGAQYLLSYNGSSLRTKKLVPMFVGLLFLLAFTTTAVLAQSKNFGYHLMAFYPMILILIFYLASIEPYSRWNLFSPKGLFIVLFASLLIVTIPFKTARTLSSVSYYQQIEKQRLEDSATRMQLSDICVGPVLYLSAGSVAYRFPFESLLRQTFPLDIQRRSDSLENSPRREEALNQVESFAGNCVFWSPGWLNSESQPWFGTAQAKIESQFTVLDPENPLVWIRQ